MVFQNLAKIEMTRNKNRLFGRYFETEQHLKIVFAELWFFIAHCKIPVGKWFSQRGSLEPPMGTNGSKSTFNENSTSTLKRVKWRLAARHIPLACAPQSTLLFNEYDYFESQLLVYWLFYSEFPKRFEYCVIIWLYFHLLFFTRFRHPCGCLLLVKPWLCKWVSQ